MCIRDRQTAEQPQAPAEYQVVTKDVVKAVSYTHLNRLQQLEDITNGYKGVEKSFAIQAGREIRIMVVPEQVSDADMVIMARDISKQIESELEYPGQIKVNVIRESRIVDYAK